MTNFQQKEKQPQRPHTILGLYVGQHVKHVTRPYYVISLVYMSFALPKMRYSTGYVYTFDTMKFIKVIFTHFLGHGGQHALSRSWTSFVPCIGLSCTNTCVGVASFGWSISMPPSILFLRIEHSSAQQSLASPRLYFLKRQQTVSTNNVAYTTEELFRMGKAQFTKIVSAFEHSMAGSAQEKLRQRSDLEAMVEQIEQETLEEQGHALLQSWQTAVFVANTFEEKGLVTAARQMGRVCEAAKQTIDKVLSPETIAAAPKPTVARVVANHAAGGEPLDPAPCVAADHGMGAGPAPPAVARVVADRASGSDQVSASSSAQQVLQGAVPCVAADHGAVARVVADRATGSDQDLSSWCYENLQGEQRSVEDLLTEVEQRSLCVQGGGEIPCHFTTLTTAIYHWNDFAQCLEKYEAATRSRRGGRSNPLEPSERQLSEERRRVLRYPGVVAWFTGYKMELFYRHVLRYEDGQGVFEWGAGGIMHLHSINVGSCMPRVDPIAAGMQRPDARTARIAARFAEIHEEYLTDWSLGKKEKWTFNEVDAFPARFRPVGSPVHTDSESDGSEGLERSDVLEKCVRRTESSGGVDVGAASDVFGQHVVSDDVDFLRVFPTPTTMSYVMHNDVRATHVLTATERETLRGLEVSLQDNDWHPCRISVAQKALC